MQTTKTFPSIDQQKLKILCDNICDKIEDLFDFFNLEYRHNGKMYAMSCPIHGGDNNTALNIYPEGDEYRGNWKCRTHRCEEIFKGSIIGFIRGILSHQKYNWQKSGDTICSFSEVLKFCESFTNTKIDNLDFCKILQNKKKFTTAINSLSNNPKNLSELKIKREQIRKSLILPCNYYLTRGFSDNILDKYDVGLCETHNKEMFNRAVVPIYDTNYKFMVGCTGRSIFKKCDKCDAYHHPKLRCPQEQDIWKYPKWKHNHGFKAQENLYNIWFAKDYILKDKYAILVESPGNVWKLEENNIHHSLAIFGTSLSAQQKFILDASGAMTLFLIMDNDDAGKHAAEAIYKKCYKTYKIHTLNIDNNDIADLTQDQIEKQIKHKIMELL